MLHRDDGVADIIEGLFAGITCGVTAGQGGYLCDPDTIFILMHEDLTHEGTVPQRGL